MRVRWELFRHSLALSIWELTDIARWYPRGHGPPQEGRGQVSTAKICYRIKQLTNLFKAWELRCMCLHNDANDIA